MTNPKATLHMANGADIVIELLPEAAAKYSKQFYLRCFPRILRPPRHRTYRSG